MIRWFKRRSVKRELVRRCARFAALFPDSEIRLVTEAGGVMALVTTLAPMSLAEYNQRWPEYARPDTGGQITPTFRDELFNPRALSSEDKINLPAALDFCRGAFEEWRKKQ